MNYPNSPLTNQEDLKEGNEKQGLSVLLPTIARNNLIDSTLESIVPQLSAEDELVISLNVPKSSVDEISARLRRLIVSIGTIKFRFIVPPRPMKIFEHWNFIFRSASRDQIVFIHDDEIYRSNLLKIAREEFSSAPDVSLVVGGQLKVYANRHTGVVASLERHFDEKRTFDGRLWIRSQEKFDIPKFGATAYMFRRTSEAFWFLEDNTRISDALLLYHQAFRGKVVERPEIFGTYLQYSSNSTLTDTLEANHNPYWRALKKMGQLEYEEQLIDNSEKVRILSIRNYSACALNAAIPLRDKIGYDECLNQIRLAGGNVTGILSIIDRLPGKWIYMPPIMSVLKKLYRRLGAGKLPNNAGSSSTMISEILDLPLALVESFRARAQENAR
jgi:hypothetical protein